MYQMKPGETGPSAAHHSGHEHESMWPLLKTYWHPLAMVFLPFSAGYFLSYFYRTINAVIAGALSQELGLNAAHLGLMTSVYFFTFAVIQLPLGVLLDRFGPRRVQSALLFIAAGGAMLFASADQFATLILGRALIGLGAAGALIAGLKAIAMWFPKERIPLLNGCFIMLGTLGAVAATSPAEWLQDQVGWRSMLGLTGATTAVIAFVIFVLVPEQRLLLPAPTPGSAVGLRAIYGDARFWRLAPLSTMCISTAWAIQGLWAAPWLADVDGLSHGGIVRHLFVMALTLSAAALVLGIGADRLRGRGIAPQTMLGCAAVLFISAELVLILDPHSLSYAPWAVVAGMGAATVLSYSILAQYFPKQAAGRANAALNVFHIGGAFLLQDFIGWVIDRWPANGGHYPPIAYKSALALLIGLQLIALLWFGRRDQKLRAAAPEISSP